MLAGFPGKTGLSGRLWREREEYALDNFRGSSGVVALGFYSAYRRRPDPHFDRPSGHCLDLQPGYWKQAWLGLVIAAGV